MSRAKLIYALADLVREVRLSIEEKNERIRQLEREQARREKEASHE